MTEQEEGYDALLERSSDSSEVTLGTERGLDGLLAELEWIQGQKGRWADTGDLGKLYKELRDEAVSHLDMGPRYFLDDDGVKTIAVRQQSMRTVVDLDVLMAAIKDEDLLDQIAPRKLDAEGYKRAVATGKIPDALFVKATKLVPSAAFVKFIRADAGE